MNEKMPPPEEQPTIIEKSLLHWIEKLKDQNADQHPPDSVFESVFKGINKSVAISTMRRRELLHILRKAGRGKLAEKLAETYKIDF